MKLDNNSVDILYETIKEVLHRIYIQDIELVQRGGMERSISFRFGLYFNELISKYDKFRELNIDLEYNKNGLEPKRTPRRPKGVQPDFILHRRRDNDQNILVIEFKGWWNNTDRNIDQVKLEDFVSQEGEYKYGMGVLVELNIDSYNLTTFFDYSIELT